MQSARPAADFWEAPRWQTEYQFMKTVKTKRPLKVNEQLDSSRETNASFWRRLYFALGPIAGCMVLDLADFLTLGPIGLVIGVPVGAAIGWWLGSLYGFQTQGRAVLAVLSGIYCTIPFTEVIPVATIVGAIARFYDPPKAA
jgi:hypothetical protein